MVAVAQGEGKAGPASRHASLFFAKIQRHGRRNAARARRVHESGPSGPLAPAGSAPSDGRSGSHRGPCGWALNAAPGGAGRASVLRQSGYRPLRRQRRPVGRPAPITFQSGGAATAERAAQPNAQGGCSSSREIEVTGYIRIQHHCSSAVLAASSACILFVLTPSPHCPAMLHLLRVLEICIRIPSPARTPRPVVARPEAQAAGPNKSK